MAGAHGAGVRGLCEYGGEPGMPGRGRCRPAAPGPPALSRLPSRPHQRDGGDAATVEDAAGQVNLPRASRPPWKLVPVRVGVSGFSWDALGMPPGGSG